MVGEIDNSVVDLTFYKDLCEIYTWNELFAVNSVPFKQCTITMLMEKIINFKMI